MKEPISGEVKMTRNFTKYPLFYGYKNKGEGHFLRTK